MTWQQRLKRQIHVQRGFAVQFLGLLVSANGLYILASTLLVQIGSPHGPRLNHIVLDLPLLIGLGLVYLGALLRRRKRTAWLVTIGAYGFYMGLGIFQLLHRHHMAIHGEHELVRIFIVPLVVLGLLVLFQSEYVVRSDIQGFGFAARFSFVIMLAAFIYGVVGFQLLDKSDFHKDFKLSTAIHYTIDQFNLTIDEPLHAYTKRARLFEDSLSVVSVGAVAYAALSLFQPLRVRLADHSHDREHMTDLLKQHGGLSEEFFKIWPHDKQFLFDTTGASGLAFHVSRGVALCLSGPAGDPATFKNLMRDFTNICFGNDWLPALIHVEDKHRAMYEKFGFGLQKLGQEAVVDIKGFNDQTAGSKYFRQIRNKFEKRGYSYELLTPPHHEAVMDRLRSISDEWLSQGGRAERGFVMGYFTTEYMQQCQLMVGRDAAGTIQAFVNLVPADFDKQEATFDMLRHSRASLGNINDFLLMGLIKHLQELGYQRLNLGLCPLVGLDEEVDQERSRLINRFLSFAYANGDRFYSFQGLYRFKAKYQPEWRDRYVAYQGGLRGFTRTMSALMRAMKL